MAEFAAKSGLHLTLLVELDCSMAGLTRGDGVNRNSRLVGRLLLRRDVWEGLDAVAAEDQAEQRPVETVGDRAAHHIAGELGRGRDRGARQQRVGDEIVMRAEVVVQILGAELPWTAGIFETAAERPAPAVLGNGSGRTVARHQAG